MTNASKQIDDMIAQYPDWRGTLLTQLRKVILEADPGMTETWKWGTGVWNHNGNICAIAAFKDHVKINFFDGAVLKDEDKQFNSGLDAKLTRTIDFHEDDQIDVPGLKSLVKVAVAYRQK